jgi:Na+-transporting methylmalonyl-CoA/oxaloacetate decarboxylase gamma subunit
MDAFGWMIAGVGVVGVVVAVLVAFTESAHDQIGRGGLDTPPPPPEPGSAAAHREADEEIRQLVEAKSARREARGLAPLDVDAEIRTLKRAPAPRRVDPALREEVRGLVEARNERRARRGKAPLDVEEEIDRRLRELGG